MNIEYIQVGANRIAQNPLTGDWFVYIGNDKAGSYICQSKADAVALAKRKGKR